MRLAMLLPVLALQGCMTFSGDRLPEIEPLTPRNSPSIDFAVGDFRFELDGGALRSSVGVGRDLNAEIASRWLRHGYVSNYSELGRDGASGSGDYVLTLSGNLDGESSVVLQVISGLTLLAIPYYVDRHASLSYELSHRKSGKVWRASVAEDSRVVVWLPFIIVLPLYNLGQSSSIDKMAHHLYSRFVSQGAFQ